MHCTRASWEVPTATSIPILCFERKTLTLNLSDLVVSSKVTMNPSWLLYLVLAIQPALTIAAYLSARFFSRTPLDSGFGIVAILAGVRKETLRLLSGASMSGHVSKPVRMQITVEDHPITTGQPAPPGVEYILDGQEANESLSHSLRSRSPLISSSVRHLHNRLSNKDTQYEMVPR